MTTPASRILSRAVGVAAAVGVTAAFASPGFAQCCDTEAEPARGDDLQYVMLVDEAAGEAASSTRPAKSAEEMISDLQAAQSIDEALPIAREFVQAYPDHEAAPQLMYVVAMYESDIEAKKTLFRQLIEKHPDTQFAQMAQGSLSKMERIGEPFELTFEEAVSGKTINVQEDLKGKVLVIDFWATWCGPCIAELPEMMDIYSDFKDQGVEFIGVSLDAPPEQGGREKLLTFVKERQIPWPQYYQGNGWQSEFSRSWGITSIPAIFVVDAEGKLHSTEARGQLRQILPRLIAQRDQQAQGDASNDSPEAQPAAMVE